jgi:hypothetical protein
MSRIVIVILIHHRYKSTDSVFPVKYGQSYRVELSFK